MSAVEEEPGETGGQGAQAGDGHTHEQACLNCGAALVGEHCHACGQRAHVHRTLGAFWHDLLHGVLHFEGKTWRTLPMLAWRPGQLTRRYIDGERAKFVSPIAMFLFSVFLMFAVFNIVGSPFSVQGQPLSSPEGIRNLEQQAEALELRAATLRQEQERLRQARQPTTQVDAQIEAVRSERQAVEAGRRIATGGAEPSDKAAVDFDLSDVSVDTGSPLLDYAMQKWVKNPSLMLYKLQANAYKFSWALIPISVPFLALLFLWRRRHQRLYDHTVFVTYSLTFVTLLLVAASMLRGIGIAEDAAVLAMIIIIPLHMFRQLKGAYQLRFFSALWRTAALLAFSIASTALFLLLLLWMGAF